MADTEDHSEDTLTDQEFLKQIRERLQKTGNFVLIVDSANVQFARIVSVVLGIGALILLTLFGFNIEKMGDELTSANETLTEANASLDGATIALTNKTEVFETRFEDAMARANEQLEAIDDEKTRVRRIADRNLEQAVTTFADLISEAYVGSGSEGPENRERQAAIFRSYLQKNIDFARQEGNTEVEIAMLRSLAFLERDLNNLSDFNEYFETAIEIARREELFMLAAELQVEYARNRLINFSLQGAPVTAKARLLLQKALLNYESVGLLRDEEDAQLQFAMAETHTRIAETFELEASPELALEELWKARVLFMKLPPSDEHLNVMAFQARLNEQLGDLETATRLINESISVAEDLGKFNFILDKHLKLASLSDDPNEKTTQLCRAWNALKRTDPDERKSQRFLKRAEKVLAEFEVGSC